MGSGGLPLLTRLILMSLDPCLYLPLTAWPIVNISPFNNSNPLNNLRRRRTFQNPSSGHY
jgi:hypothetical protein